MIPLTVEQLRAGLTTEQREKLRRVLNVGAAISVSAVSAPKTKREKVKHGV